MAWWNSSWSMLEPETTNSINMQDKKVNKDDFTSWSCGCEHSTKGGGSHLHICQWHEGFDEGAVAVKAGRSDLITG